MGWDYRDTKAAHRFEFLQVSAHNLEEVYGTLDAVDLSGCSVDMGYYTDTRASAKVRYLLDGWKRGSLIRIIDHVDSADYHEALGTFVVTDDPSKLSNGVWVTDLALNSTLYMLSKDLLASPITVAAGASLKAAMCNIISGGLRQYRQPTWDKAATSTTVFETGKSRLSCLFALADMAGVRLDVDGMGYITMEPYVAPQQRTARLEINLNDPRSVAHDDLSRSSDWMKLPSMAVVSYKYTENGSGGKSVEHEIVGVAQAKDGDWHAASGPRGYRVTDYTSLNEMEPATKQHANELAAQRLAKLSPETVNWSLTTQALPLREGDAVALVLPDGGSQLGYEQRQRAFVKSMTYNLGDGTMKLTLKNVNGGDE